MTAKAKSILIVALLSCIIIVIAMYRSSANQTPRVTYIHGSYVVNPQNTRAVVGLCSHVFIARITEQLGSDDSRSAPPKTFFSAEVMGTIKGDTEKSVTLAQFALYDGENRIRIIEEGDQALLVGQTYLFIASYDKQMDRYSIFPGGYGNIPITDNNQKAEVIAKYTEAYKNELPFDPNNPDHLSTPDPRNPTPTIQTYPYPASEQLHLRADRWHRQHG